MGDIQKQIGKQFADSQKESKEQFSASQTESREQFASSQKQMADKFSEALKISAKPKLTRTQPTFTPKHDIDDYELYRKFKKDFQHFISDVDKDNWEDKIEWLQRCVKDDAHRRIKEVTIDEAGYNNAFEILDTKYLCTNKIKNNIFHYIHKAYRKNEPNL